MVEVQYVFIKSNFELRCNHKLSQEEFTKNIGVSKETVEEWENGISLPASEYLIEICHYFQISLDQLIDENTEKMTGKHHRKLYPEWEAYACVSS